MRIDIILILVSSLHFLCSCGLKSRNTELTIIDHEPFKCCMDSSINEFQLMDSESFDSVFSCQVDNYKVNNCQLGEGIYVSNSLDNEFIFMKFNNGGIGHEFEAFFVTDSIPAKFYSHLMHSNIPQFVSTNGAHIGMSREDFLNIYSTMNNMGLDSLYIRHDTINMLYNHFLFRQDTLKSIEIGYDW